MKFPNKERNLNPSGSGVGPTLIQVESIGHPSSCVSGQKYFLVWYF